MCGGVVIDSISNHRGPIASISRSTHPEAPTAMGADGLEGSINGCSWHAGGD
jgi:hypothetical protein